MNVFNKKNEIRPETAEHIQDLANLNYAIEFPIDLNLESMIHVSLPEIKWINFDAIPSSMKISNTGKSVILTTHWTDKQRPHLSGGPLLGTYAFSQLHFIWGRKDFRGGKHTYNKKTFPLEIHALFYKCEYGSRTEAFKHKDGAIVIVFASKLDKQANPAMEKVCSFLPALSDGDVSASVQVDPPFKLSDLLHRFAADYFLYWGTVTTTYCNHLMLWMVCRKPFHISSSQVHHFRKLMTAKQNHIIINSQNTARIHPNFNRVFHINPSKFIDDVIYDKGIPKYSLPEKAINEMNKNTSDRPSTAGLNSTRIKFQSGIPRPATSTGVGHSRKEDDISMRYFPRGRNIERHGRNGKDFEKDFLVSNTEGSVSQEEFECRHESVEQIFLGKMGGLKVFRKTDLETIYSEGSEHSVPSDETIRLASVKDSLEKIRQNLDKKGVSDDEVSKGRADSANMREENKCRKIKSRRVACENNAGKKVPQINNTKKANSPPPRWRY